MARYIGAIAAGILVGFATVWIVETIGHALYPLPSDIALDDPAAAGRHADSMPIGAQLFVIAAWFLGALAGGSVAARIAQARWAAWLVGAAVAIGAVAFIFWIPHPEAMQIAAVVAPLAGGLVAGHWPAARAPRMKRRASDA
ncbi:hypothetical protein [Sphingosinicella rhizophila]|uniref:Uncharacterized protein n=1 Tax=Sphingosinicella rhizophila TaxID=3050082 RepID=A0ABU3Q882_9SPHN|nr:hypothetical protein [Sphingosinicella sp. GR2756]MDT9599618.1 hypothetical protein [Sphingosinicella sp. GR2756]